jgi:hypothetical protein
MVSQRKRSLFVGLGLTVGLVLAVVLPATASAVSRLTGEHLSTFVSGSSVGTAQCDSPTFNVSGPASGPYPGTFMEAGTWNTTLNTFSATFTITSGTTTITGSKTGTSGGTCGASGAFTLAQPSYTATIHTPNGSFHDEGGSVVFAAVDIGFPDNSASLTEDFTSSLTAPIAPTSKDQCKNNGWKNFPQFKNQGECVSFVESHPKT